MKSWRVHKRKKPDGKYALAVNMFYLGHNDDGGNIGLTAEYMRTHALVYGTAGSGRDMAVMSMSANAFALGTGLCHIDPKGDPRLVRKLFKMARRAGREDDFLALRFSKPVPEKTAFPAKCSNGFNPFANADSDAIANILSSLLPADDCGNSILQQKAQALIIALVKALVALRDAKCALPLTKNFNGIPKGKFGGGLSIDIIRDYLDPVNCAGLVFPLKTRAEPRAVDVEKIRLKLESGEAREEDLSEHEAVALYVDEPILDVLKAAISSLGYDPRKGEILEQQNYIDQFGCVKGYFGYPLALLSEMCGGVPNPGSEVDMRDCLFNRRILVNSLPMMEKSPTECSPLGKIILASVKNSVSRALGNKIEESTKTIIGSSFVSPRAPGIIVVDEYAAIMTPGFEVILTQARSLGFMAIIAAQGDNCLKGAGEKHYNQIIWNTGVKIFMKTGNSDSAGNLVKNMFGDAVSQSDLALQTEGQFHMFDGAGFIKGTIPPMILLEEKNDIFRLNRFLAADVSKEHIKEHFLEWEKEGGQALRDCGIFEA